MIDKGADLETKDNDGKTLLHLSAWNRQFESLKYLIGIGARVNGRDNHNSTPLHILGHHPPWLMVEEPPQFCLRVAEADLTAFNNAGKTPMENESVQELREQKPELFPQN